MELVDIISLDAKEMVPEINIVTRKIVTTQRIALNRSFFAEAGSDFDTGLIPFISVIIDGGRQDKSYGLGRVGFPRTELTVAVRAVPV